MTIACRCLSSLMKHTTWFHANLGLPHVITPILVLAGTALFGVLYYYVARGLQRARGVDIALAFKTIPPE